MSKTSAALTAILVLAALTTAARADLTIQSTVSSQGLVGLTNMEGTQTQAIAGDAAKTQSNMRMTNKLMKMLGGGKPQDTAEIIRLDMELFWDVNNKDKEYKERTFAEVRQEMEKGLKDAEKERAKYEKDHPGEADKLQTEVKVEATGKTQQIAGYETAETVVSMLVYGKNAETGEKGAMKLTMDLWLARDVPGAEDVQRFYSALATKLGFTGHGQQSMEGMLAAFGVDPRDLYKHTKDLQGMSLMSTVTLGMEGEPAAGGDSPAKVAKEKPAKEPEPPEASDSDAKAQVAKKLGGLFGKKKDKDASADQAEQGGKKEVPAGPSFLMQFTSTVTKVSSGAVAASEFEIPADFKKK
jgi:hypothetical protein